ncbi:MAG: FHIPEP family type III secretion protein [Candidatus Eremiobacteraeota bacterium]|nr:FHIPEP family type III secretion protein [Candidatus Eremiobacteraeota bacterium]
MKMNIGDNPFDTYKKAPLSFCMLKGISMPLVLVLLLVTLPLRTLDILLAVNFCLAVAMIAGARLISDPLRFKIFPAFMRAVIPVRFALTVAAARAFIEWSGTPLEFAAMGPGKVIPAFGNALAGGNATEGAFVLAILVILTVSVFEGLRKKLSLPDETNLYEESLPGESPEAFEGKNSRNWKRYEFYNDIHYASVQARLEFSASLVVTCIALGISRSFPHCLAILNGFMVLIMLPCFLQGLALDLLFTTAASRDRLRSAESLLPQSMAFYSASVLLALLGFLELLGLLRHPSIPYFLLAELLAIAGKFTERHWLPLLKDGAAAPAGDASAAGTGLSRHSFISLNVIMAALTRGKASAKKDQRNEPARKEDTSKKPSGTAGQEGAAPAKSRESLTEKSNKSLQSAAELLEVDPICICVGRSLLCLVDPNQGAKLLERMTATRRHMALDLGIVLPGVRFRDDLQLPPDGYVIKIKETTVATGSVKPGQLLAIGPEEKCHNLRGTMVNDPVFGMPGVWISPEQRGDAERLGLMVFEPVSVVATHITMMARRHAGDLVGYQEMKALLDTLKKKHPEVVNSLIPDEISIRELRGVCVRLLAEGVSIRDLSTILEIISDSIVRTKDLDELTELVRKSLGRALCTPLAYEGMLAVITLDHEVSGLIEGSLRHCEDGVALTLKPHTGLEFLKLLRQAMERLMLEGFRPVLLCAPSIRPSLARLTRGVFPDLSVLSFQEVPPDMRISVVTTITAWSSEIVELELQEAS